MSITDNCADTTTITVDLNGLGGGARSHLLACTVVLDSTVLNQADLSNNIVVD